MFEDIKLRKGQPSTKLNEETFKSEFKKQFFDPRFQGIHAALEQITETAWRNYAEHRKAPMTVKAGPEFADPSYDLSQEWLETRDRLLTAEVARATSVSRILVINGSPRSEYTCPGEVSKSFRMAELAVKTIEAQGLVTDLLDLSRLTSEYGKNIHPCKACVSSAMPLCHWPCSCYPNHSLGQTQDWMGEIYEKWVRAHGVLIITPVHWYQVPSTLKLMMDRLVCADGGNPDPTSTHGKDALKAKKIELKGWDYPKHLKGRAFSVVAHGDVVGAEGVRRDLSDWLCDMELIPCGANAEVDGYIGYYEPYATSHGALDKAESFMREIEIASLALVRKVGEIRRGQCPPTESEADHPIKK